MAAALLCHCQIPFPSWFWDWCLCDMGARRAHLASKGCVLAGRAWPQPCAARATIRTAAREALSPKANLTPPVLTPPLRAHRNISICKHSRDCWCASASYLLLFSPRGKRVQYQQVQQHGRLRMDALAIDQPMHQPGSTCLNTPHQAWAAGCTDCHQGSMLLPKTVRKGGEGNCHPASEAILLTGRSWGVAGIVRPALRQGTWPHDPEEPDAAPPGVPPCLWCLRQPTVGTG